MVAQDFPPSKERGWKACSMFRNSLVEPQAAFQHRRVWSRPKERNGLVDPEATWVKIRPVWESEFLKSATKWEVGHIFLAFTWIHQYIFYRKWRKPNLDQFNLFFFKQDVLTLEIENPKDMCLQTGLGLEVQKSLTKFMPTLHLLTSFWVLVSFFSRFSSHGQLSLWAIFLKVDILRQKKIFSLLGSIYKIKEASTLLGPYLHPEPTAGTRRGENFDFQSGPCIDSSSTGEACIARCNHYLIPPLGWPDSPS